MYGLPSNIDLSFFVKATLLQICIGANEVVLGFDREVSVTIESRFRVCDANGHATDFEDAPSAATSLVKFVGDRVLAIDGNPDGTLRLSFVKGGFIEVYDSSKNYESYQIKHGTALYVV